MTLVELIVVLALLAIFLGIGIGALQRLRYQYEVRQAQQTMVQELNRARSTARRLSQDQKITLQSDPGSIKIEGSGGERVVPLSSSEAVTVRPNRGRTMEFTYFAPYSRVGATDLEYILEGRGNTRVAVRVFGVTGKVAAIGKPAER